MWSGIICQPEWVGLVLGVHSWILCRELWSSCGHWIYQTLLCPPNPSLSKLFPSWRSKTSWRWFKFAAVKTNPLKAGNTTGDSSGIAMISCVFFGGVGNQECILSECGTLRNPKPWGKQELGQQYFRSLLYMWSVGSISLRSWKSARFQNDKGQVGHTMSVTQCWRQYHWGIN